jgi:hypothetical protein
MRETRQGDATSRVPSASQSLDNAVTGPNLLTARVRDTKIENLPCALLRGCRMMDTFFVSIC